MNVKELIDKLQQYDETMVVLLECDHGQTPMKANCVTESFTTKGYMAEHIHKDDIDDYSKDQYEKVVIIEAY